jgi:anaerobic magnesium-protoporphyrin IX monomethyl ester cyclase
MKKHPVIFIAYKDYDNLGIGYMESILATAGYKTKTINLTRNKYDILRILKDLNPEILGFSVIFEENLERFRDIVNFLRNKGINCHFTAGGHYASLKYEKLFEYLPQLDSIVRFEGEYTMLELVNHLYNGSDWKRTKGIAYKENGHMLTNKPRSFEKDLDKFPFPIRPSLREYAFNKKFATIIAGRGCVHNCSFCNIRKFYSYHLGSPKRIRRPEMVVEEMFILYNKKNCRIFLFQDDDFPVKTSYGSDWVKNFCKELNNRGLSNKIIWKISCRSDEVEYDTFLLMKNNGLFMVFIGIEEGTDDGLKRMNKELTVSQNLKGINILKRLGIGIDFGFMIFHPSTTYTSFNENLSFLRKTFGDGYTPINVNKMIPSYDTRVENDLKKEGRLKISGYIYDYDFLVDSMNRYYDFLSECFSEWQHYPYGVVNLTQWARNYYLVYFHYSDENNEILLLFHQLKKIISESNIFFLDTMKELLTIFESGQYLTEKKSFLDNYRNRIERKHESLRKKIQNNLDTLMLYALVY